MSNGRVNGVLAVARSLGDFYLHPYITAEPFLHEITLTNDSEFIVFGCDGLFDMLSDDYVVQIARQSFLAGNDANRTAAVLRDTAYLNLSSDNISVIVVQLKDHFT